ncbi:MAG: DUF4258 domain-containing protein [Chitinophagales bacterium]
MIQRLSSIFLLLVLFFNTSCETQPAFEANAMPASIPELIYTKHARCRMDCRQIDESEVREIVSQNHINRAKSNPNDSRCPTYAYEGYSYDRQHLRIVIARCKTVWKVVTCIDLENEFICSCR